MTNPKNLDDCMELARKKEAFEFGNVVSVFYDGNLATNTPPRYVVYSYGHHYPMYVYDYEACQWIGNESKSTQTTERHKSKFKPYSVAQWVDLHTLKSIAEYGLVNTTSHRMEQCTPR